MSIASVSRVNIRSAAGMSLFQPGATMITSVPVPIIASAASNCRRSAGSPLLVNSTGV
jgi:hypothetical protein